MASSNISTTPGVDLTLARSAAYGCLAEAFRWPDDDFWATLSDRARWENWPELLGERDDQVRQRIRRLQEFLFSSDPNVSVGLEELQEAHVRLFGHTVRGACPPYELEYGTSEIFQRTSELADIRGFYSAFGMEPAPHECERPDHVSVECEFMSVVAMKEAHALELDQAEGVETIREGQKRFLESHLGRWLPSLARRIGEADPEGFFGALGAFAGAFVAFECKAFDADCGPQLLELRAVDEKEETAQACAIEDFGAGCPIRSGPDGQPGPLSEGS